MEIKEAIEQTRGIEGWMTDSQLETLGDLCKNCSVFIEVGTYKGKTTKFLSLVCPGLIIAVDNFLGADNMTWMANNSSDIMNEFKQNMGQAIPSGKVKLYVGDSVKVAHTFQSHNIHVDCVFIDGDHSYEGVKRDIIAYTPLVKSDGGVLCGHDYCDPVTGVTIDHFGVKQAVDEMFSNVSVRYGIWIVRPN